MPQQTATFLLRGGLNLVTPAVAIAPGQCTAAMNYEPDTMGYRRIGGYERYDGQPAPSDGADASAASSRRSAITAVPGSGMVRGVHVYDGAVWAFRDSVTNVGKLFKATDGGWVEQTFGHIVYFNTGTAEFLEGEVLLGGTSTATATIDRVVLHSGTWGGGTAEGYLVISEIVGTFGAEVATSTSGSATIAGSTAIEIAAGGRYDIITHNFYGAAYRPRMYAANGVGAAMEWDGEVLAPILTGNAAGPLDEISYLLAANGDFILAADGDSIILVGDNDTPTHIGQYRNHLFLGFDAGSIINSGIGEPLDYRATAGAAETAFGGRVTGFLTAAATALAVFGDTRIEYITGNDSSDFVMSPISDRSGAKEWSMQMGGEQPIMLDDAGLRRLSTTSAFGDWRVGTLSQSVEPFFKAKRAAGAQVVASIVKRSRDQYWIFWDDATGLVVYLGRKQPEVMTFLLPATVSCACVGELTEGAGERYFIGCTDGYVYELDKGSSFDGAEVQAYMRLAWNAAGAPAQHKRFHKASFEIDAPDACEIGVAFHLDNAIAANSGTRVDTSVAQGSQSLISFGDYDAITWSTPTEGLLDLHVDGIGRNIGFTVVSEHTDEEPHTLSALTVNFSPRRALR